MEQLLIRTIKYLLGEGPVAIDGELWEGDKVPLFGKAPNNSVSVTEANSPARPLSDDKKDPDQIV